MVAVAGEQDASGAVRSIWELLPAERFQLSATRELQRRHLVSILVFSKQLVLQEEASCGAAHRSHDIRDIWDDLRAEVWPRLLRMTARKTLPRWLRGSRLLAWHESPHDCQPPDLRLSRTCPHFLHAKRKSLRRPASLLPIVPPRS